MKQRNLQISCIAKANKGFCFQPLLLFYHIWEVIEASAPPVVSGFNLCCSEAWPALWILEYPDTFLVVKGGFWKLFFGI